MGERATACFGWRSSGASTALGLALAILAGGPASGQSSVETLTYVLTPDFERGRLQVEVNWKTAGRKMSVLAVAQRFGRIDDVPALLGNVQIEGARSIKRDGGMWIVTHAAGQTLRASYELDHRRKAFDWDSVHVPTVTPEFFCGIGSTFLLVPNSYPGTPGQFETVLRWALPAGCKAVCSWGTGRHVGARMAPADLRQSVYLAGTLATQTVERDGLNVTVALVDRFGFKADEFARQTTAIIKAQCDFMAETRFPEFVVTAVPVGEPLRPGESRLAGSGLYHSFALFVAPQSQWNDAVEHLFSHELFHYWNGRVLAAQEPERLVYWFVEGLTDYYALRILFESKHWDAATYAKWLNKHLREYAANPARNASNEDIDAHYWDQRDTVGQVAYQRGLLLGLRWQALAKKNGAREGFDRLFRSLIDRGRTGFQVNNAAIREAGVKALGAWFGPEFDRYVTRAETIDVPIDALAPQLLGKKTTFDSKAGTLDVLEFRPAKE